MGSAFTLVVVVILLMGPVFIYFCLSFQFFCVSAYALGSALGLGLIKLK